MAFPVIISCMHITTTATIATRPLNISPSRIMLRITGETAGMLMSLLGVKRSKRASSFRCFTATARAHARISTVAMLTSTPGLKMPPVCRAGAMPPSASLLSRPSMSARSSCMISASGRPTAPSMARRATTSSTFRDCSKCPSVLRPRGSKKAWPWLPLGIAGVSSCARSADRRGRRVAAATAMLKPASDPLASADARDAAAVGSCAGAAVLPTPCPTVGSCTGAPANAANARGAIAGAMAR
mmetsp:Transcript_22864/g.60399  ORF Transcript_22864/g.60399 Transcript_22864/m.60399 type:complete len:242 (+) Transcript_22864:92-817(+)